MRLLHTTTLRLHDFIDHHRKPYSILSHTWGKEEVSFQEIQKDDCSLLKGYVKIQGACKLALEDGFEYIWIDTCCIDKSSSAELSEAINSMYSWYQNARCCYVYLSDVEARSGSLDPKYLKYLCNSRWFRRGWTLQELLAPRNVLFFDCQWSFIGDKYELKTDIEMATGIEGITPLMQPSEKSVATKMSWAALRETTRPEDEAYCLMGLFNVNMPLLYGEGRKAFRRLQYEIARNIDDESLFAWREPRLESGLFAPSPKSFIWSADIDPKYPPSFERIPSTITNRGLRFDALCKNVPRELIRLCHIEAGVDPPDSTEYLLCPLNCVRRYTPTGEQPFVIILKKRKGSNVATRFLPGQLLNFHSCFPSFDQLTHWTIDVADSDNHSASWLFPEPVFCLSAIEIPVGLCVWYATPPSYLQHRKDGGDVLIFANVPAFAIISINSSTPPSPVIILDHVEDGDGKYHFMVRFDLSGGSVKDCYEAWLHSYSSSSDLTGHWWSALRCRPVILPGQLDKRKELGNSQPFHADRESEFCKQFAIGTQQTNSGLWQLDIKHLDSST